MPLRKNQYENFKLGILGKIVVPGLSLKHSVQFSACPGKWEVARECAERGVHSWGRRKEEGRLKCLFSSLHFCQKGWGRQGKPKQTRLAEVWGSCDANWEHGLATAAVLGCPGWGSEQRGTKTQHSGHLEGMRRMCPTPVKFLGQWVCKSSTSLPSQTCASPCPEQVQWSWCPRCFSLMGCQSFSSCTKPLFLAPQGACWSYFYWKSQTNARKCGRAVGEV